jgi:hypothetical protein
MRSRFFRWRRPVAVVLVAAGCGNAPTAPDGRRPLDSAPAVDGAVSSSCGAAPQRHCNAGERCAYFQPGWSLGCTSIPGTDGPGEACTAPLGEPDSCLPTLGCVDGICRRSCGMPEYQCVDGGWCPNGAPALCTAPCDPLAPVCLAGQACIVPYRSPAGWIESPGCSVPGTGDIGSVCFMADACLAGLGCQPTTGTCQAICRVDGSDNRCTGGAVCTPRIATDAHGLCTPPT